MEDRNRRDQRIRSHRDREQFRDSGDPYASRQAEQFDDSSSWAQDRGWSPEDRYTQQAGENRFSQDHRSAMSDWRDPTPRSGRESFGWAGGRAARDPGFGDDYYDNGMSAYDAGEARRRSSPPTRSRSDREERGGQTERGFLERAGDEVASWFGDVDAARRREQDHRGKGPANYKRTDERILEDVCDCLTEDRRVDARNVQVTVNEGEVTLDGTVDSREAKRRAEDLVDDISGVGHVQNNLRVKDAAADATFARDT